MKFATSSLVVIGISAANAFTLRTSTSVSTRTSSTATQLNAEKRRVVVTGLGVISGCGIGHETFFQNCVDGVSSLGTITRFDPTHYPCKIGSEVPDDMFDPKDHFVNAKNAKSNDRFTHFAVAAARLALKDADLGDTPETLKDPEMCGTTMWEAGLAT